MTAPKRIRPERVWRCVGCGLPRYYVTKPCPTCARLARRHALWGHRG